MSFGKSKLPGAGSQPTDSLSSSSNYIDVAAAVIIIYDTFLSLSDEIEFVWKRNLSLGSVLYIFTRYATIIQLVVFIPLDVARLSFQTCNNLIRTSHVMFVFCTLGVSGLSLARAYAICYKKRSIISALLVLFLIGNTVYIASAFRHSDCGVPWNKVDGTLGLLSLITALLFEFGVLLISLYHLNVTQKHLPTKHFTRLFFQQGIYRFVTTAALCLVAIIDATVFNPSIIDLGLSLEFALTAILMCRFLIQLRKFRRTFDVSDHPEGFLESNPRASLVGSVIDRASRSVVLEFSDPQNTSTNDASTQTDIEARVTRNL